MKDMTIRGRLEITIMVGYFIIKGMLIICLQFLKPIMLFHNYNYINEQHGNMKFAKETD